MSLKSFSTFLFFSVSLCSLSGTFTGCGKNNRAAPITYTEEIQQLRDVTQWATPPVGKAALLSSFDRSGGNRDWADYASLTPENGKKNILHIQGPACISRIWMTGQLGEKWEFYFDGEETPRIVGVQRRAAPRDGSYEMAFQEPLVSVTSGGQTCYVPIPIEQSLTIKIPADYAPPTPYYQINVQRFPKGTPIHSFPAIFTEKDIRTTQAARASWGTTEKDLRNAATACTNRQIFVVNAGETLTWFEQQEGPGTLQAVSMRLLEQDEHPLSQLEKNNRLRQVRLSFFWDGLRQPSVNVPLGDFFCNAFYQQPFTSLPMGHLDDTFMCRFPMPFKKGAKGQLINESEHPFRIEIGTLVSNVMAESDRYFHATWSQADRMKQAKPFPITLLNANGAGHFAGCYLNVISAEPAWNLLEGDEKFYLDGEPIPSLNGTGLEDYFNGAWYYHGLTARPLAGLLGKAAMNTDQYRWHLASRIPFAKSLRMTMEFGHVLGSPLGPNTCRGYISATAYYYLDTPTPVPAWPAAASRRQLRTPFTPFTILAELLEHERVHDFRMAQQRSLAYAEEYADQPALSDILNMRAQKYHVLGLVTNEVTFTPLTEAGQQQMQAIDADRMLIHVDTSGEFELQVNGAITLTGNNPLSLHTAVLAPAPQLDLVLRLTQPGRVLRPRFSVTLENNRRLIPVTEGWETSYGTGWKPLEAPIIFHPQMSSWNLQPNIYAGVQGPGMLMLDKKTYPIQPDRPLTLRTRIRLK